MLTDEDIHGTEIQATLFTDANLAATFAAAIEDKYVCIKGLGWHRWTGKRWETCDDKDVREVARQWTIQQHLGSIEAYKDVVADDRPKAEQQAARQETVHWERYQVKAKLDAITALASGIVTAEAAEFDAQPDLLNCDNGVIDLKTGELLPHDPGLRLRKMAPVAYRPGAEHADWAAALRAIPPEVVDWYQVHLGQAITGHMTADDIMLVQQGSGANGKTTVTSAIAGTLGDYYLTVSHRALIADPRSIPTEVAEFYGIRLAVLEELPEGRRLDVTRLKQLVATPEIPARHLYQRSFTFPATHTLLVNTNYLPQVNETDSGTWRRLALMRFPYTWRKRPEDVIANGDRLGDPGLRARLKHRQQREAVLAWLVAGAVRWYADDTPDIPKQVDTDSREWRCTADLVLGFLGEQMTFDRDSHVMTTEFDKVFNEWLESRGHHTWPTETIRARVDHHEEIAEHHVEKRQTRRHQGLSRRNEFPKAPARYTAYLGIRFR